MTFTPSNLNQSPHRTIKLNPPIPFPSPQSQEPHSSQSASNDDDLTPSSRQTDSRMSTRSRRAYYTPQTPRQFSSSAAKRESVMALGSIAHLQHYFVKNGLANKDRSNNTKGFVLALPGATELLEEDEDAFNELPEPAPPPPMPSQPYFPPGRAVPNLTDLESARREVMSQLDQVCERWGLIELTARRASSAQSNRSDEPSRSQTTPSPALDPCRRGGTEEDFVVSILALTTQAVRSVQKFILTLPDPDIFSNSAPASTQAGLEGRMSHLELSTSARPRISKAVLGSLRSSSPSGLSRGGRKSSIDPFALFKRRLTTTAPATNVTKEDPLTILRKASLEVLGCLKDIETRFRIPGSATPTAADEHFKVEGSNLPPDPVHTPPLVSAIGESEDSMSSQSTSVHLLPAMSWEYEGNVGLDDVRKEALIVKTWLEAVDGVLEGMTIINGRPRKSASKKSYGALSQANTPRGSMRNPFKKIINSVRQADDSKSTSVPHISLDEAEELDEASDVEDDLPAWARPVPTPSEPNQELQRAFMCLVHHLSADDLVYLHSPTPPDGSPASFLQSLSDGTLLCMAYNVALRQSQRPWGFIPADSIHNVLVLRNGPSETSASMSPTTSGLSRTLSHRSSFGSPTNSSSDMGEHGVRVGMTFRRMENLRVWAAALKLRYLIKPDPKKFDPKAIARLEVGWESMLEFMLLSWLDALRVEKTEELHGLAK